MKTYIFILNIFFFTFNLSAQDILNKKESIKNGEYLTKLKDTTLIKTYKKNILHGKYLDRDLSYPSFDRFYSCNYKKGKIDGELVGFEIVYSTKKVNILRREFYKNGVPIDTHYRYFNSGKIYSKCVYNKSGYGLCNSIDYNGKKNLKYQLNNGKLHDEFVEFHSNGKIAKCGKYFNGIEVGIWKEFNQDSTLKLTTRYDTLNHIIEIREFDKDGFEYCYSKHFTNNDRKGEEIRKYKSGKIKSVSTYKNRALDGVFCSYYSNGQIENQSFYINGELNGEVKYFYKNGQLESICNYKSGFRNGVFLYYDSLGTLRNKCTFINGKHEGEGYIYYSKDKLNSITTYSNGNRNGRFIEYYENGEIKEQGEYKDNKYNGEIKKYYKNGILKSSIVYSLDVPIEINGNFDENGNSIDLTLIGNYHRGLIEYKAPKKKKSKNNKVEIESVESPF